MKAIIADDEDLARDLIKNFLQKYNNIEIVTECCDGFSTVKAINEHKPEIVFLDVQMPKLTGFEVLELLEHKPIIIFTTAYDEYAVKAFELNAIDYLLKPFSQERFDKAISKAFSVLNANLPQPESKTSNLETYIDENTALIERIVIKKASQLIVVPIENIYYIESQDDYVMIYDEKANYLKQKTMKYFESILDKEKFIRIHRSYIVNIEKIQKLELYEKDSYLVILKNGVQLKASRSGYQNLKVLFK